MGDIREKYKYRNNNGKKDLEKLRKIFVLQDVTLDDSDNDAIDYDYYYDQLVPEHERFFQV
jgi:hypothetical protein